MSDLRTVRIATVDCCVCASAEHQVIGEGRDFEYNSCANPWRFVRCAQCGHHYLRDRPHPEELPQVYPPQYGNYSNSEKLGLAFRLKAWIEKSTLRKVIAKVTPPIAAYDIGCGDGRLLDGLKALGVPPQALFGCEISQVAAENAQRKGYDIKIGSFESIAQPQAAYNLVFLIQVLEHLLDPRAALEKIAGMLQSGGVVVIETPSTDCLDFRWFHRRYWGGFHFPRHFNLFVREHAERLLREAGMEPVGYRVKLQPVHWVWTAHHLLMEWGVPAFLYRSFHIKNPLWLGLATMLDSLQVVFLKKSSNMQIVARKP